MFFGWLFSSFQDMVSRWPLWLVNWCMKWFQTNQAVTNCHISLYRGSVTGIHSCNHRCDTRINYLRNFYFHRWCHVLLCFCWISAVTLVQGHYWWRPLVVMAFSAWRHHVDTSLCDADYLTRHGQWRCICTESFKLRCYFRSCFSCCLASLCFSRFLMVILPWRNGVWYFAAMNLLEMWIVLPKFNLYNYESQLWW